MCRSKPGEWHGGGRGSTAGSPASPPRRHPARTDPCWQSPRGRALPRSAAVLCRGEVSSEAMPQEQANWVGTRWASPPSHKCQNLSFFLLLLCPWHCGGCPAAGASLICQAPFVASSQPSKAPPQPCSFSYRHCSQPHLGTQHQGPDTKALLKAPPRRCEQIWQWAPFRQHTPG